MILKQTWRWIKEAKWYTKWLLPTALLFLAGKFVYYIFEADPIDKALDEAPRPIEIWLENKLTITLFLAILSLILILTAYLFIYNSLRKKFLHELYVMKNSMDQRHRRATELAMATDQHFRLIDTLKYVETSPDLNKEIKKIIEISQIRQMKPINLMKQQVHNINEIIKPLNISPLNVDAAPTGRAAEVLLASAEKHLDQALLSGEYNDFARKYFFIKEELIRKLKEGIQVSAQNLSAAKRNYLEGE